MIVSVLTTALGLGTPVVAPGVGMTLSSGGRDGDAISEAIQAADQDLQKTQTFGLRNRILCILRTELQRKYGIDGWNGYGAKAVAAQSVENAEAFVKIMPFELRDPVVRVIPTGFVSFTWRQGKWRFCSVVFDTDGSAESALTTNSPNEVIGKALEVFT